ncbi:MAG: hypothetical protein FWE13_06375 [Firmicutes bacterium]|nr:hypothetical protein [Bacillota bacterium]
MKNTYHKNNKLKKTGKIILLIISLAITIFTLFTFIGCVSTFETGDFYLSVTVNAETVQEGDTITITTTFKNLSDSNIRLWDWSWSNHTLEQQPVLEHTILAWIFPYPEEIFGVLARPDIYVPRSNRWWRSLVVSGGEEIVLEQELAVCLEWYRNFAGHNVDDVEYIVVQAFLDFYLGRGHQNDFHVIKAEVKIPLIR